MNPDSAILSLIADLYAQVSALQAQLAEQNDAQPAEDPSPPYDDV